MVMAFVTDIKLVTRQNLLIVNDRISNYVIFVYKGKIVTKWAGKTE
jgi:hypothetical protein